DLELDPKLDLDLEDIENTTSSLRDKCRATVLYPPPSTFEYFVHLRPL
ncbi:14591_t:CDS:1, partial [Acaulospora colombiana]